jgi:predicted enzyme related to lactoylglutathione lyase
MATTATSSKPAQYVPPVGTFCWNEVLTTDVAKAESFYTKLFGWKTEKKDMGPMGTYTMFKSGNDYAGGMMQNPEPGAPSCWMSYIKVTNVDDSTKKAEKLGATVCVPPTDIPEIGRFSVIVDPAGASVGLFTSKHG